MRFLLLTTRIEFLLGLLSLLFLSACIPVRTSKVEKDERGNTSPNIILIMADDQGWGDTGYNDHPHLKTPHLDAMAANGVQFTRFYSASSVCSPTRASVMTGRHPLRMGICTANCGHVKKEEITLAELLKEQGYSTGHFGKWHLGTLTKDTLDANRGGQKKHDEHYAPPWEHGFDECFSTESKVPTYDPMITPDKSRGGVSDQGLGNPYGTYYWTGPGQIETENLRGNNSRIIMDRAIPFIEKADKADKPFLAVIWFHTPHLPVIAGEEDKTQYNHLSEDQQHYYGSISALDKQVGRLRGKLRELGIERESMIWYCSDNGPEGPNIEGKYQGLTKGLRGRKRSLYEGGIRVPGILEWPEKVAGGKVIEAPCFTSDYFASITAVMGIDLSPYRRPYDGINLFPIIEGKQTERGNYMAFEIRQQAALIGDRYKIYSKDTAKSFELYDLSTDQGEENDLADKNPKKLAELEQIWKDWFDSRSRSAAGEDYK